MIMISDKSCWDSTTKRDQLLKECIAQVLNAREKVLFLKAIMINTLSLSSEIPVCDPTITVVNFTFASSL